ncbi:MAG: PAS-domain containing protein [Acetobacteraceae bacterium]
MIAATSDLPGRLHALARRQASIRNTPHQLRLAGLVLACLTLALAPLYIWNGNHRTLEVASGELANFAQALGAAAEQHLQVIDLLTQRAQAELTAQSADTAEEFAQRVDGTSTQSFINGLMSNLPPHHAMALFAASGQCLVCGQREPFSIADRRYFITLRDKPDDGSILEFVERAYHSGQPSIISARRLTSAHGLFLGVVLVAMDVQHLLDFYAALERRKPVRVSWLRPDGSVLFRYPSNPGGQVTGTTDSHWHKIVSAGGGTFRATDPLSGERALIAVDVLRRYNLVLQVSMDERAILAPFVWENAAVSLTVAAFAALILLLSWTIARHVAVRDAQHSALLESDIALRQSETRLRDFAEMASDWFWEQDADLRLSWVSVNSPGLGLHEAGRTGMLQWDYIDTGEEPQKWDAHRQDLYARRAFTDFRYRQRTPDGSFRYFAISGRPRFDDSGRFVGYRGIGRHITAQIEMEQERARARQRAERAEAMLRDALDSLSESVVICDEHDRVIMVNEAYRLRYPADDSATPNGRTFEQVMRDSMAAGEGTDRAGREAWLAERMHRHRTAAGEFERLLPDGTWVWITERRMRNGGTVTLHVDISRMKETEIALRHSEERLDLAQAAAGIGTWEYNLATHRWFWSKEMYRVHGLDPVCSEPATSAGIAAVHPGDLDKAQAWLKALCAGIECEPLEERITRPDGAQRLLRLHGRAVTDGTRNVSRIVGTCQDITDRQQIEQQLVQAQKMEAIGNLTGGMAHDFNNVLSIVINNLELAELSLDPESPPREWIKDALEAALRGADLTQRLLAFARRQALTYEPLDLNEVVSNLQRLLSRVLGEDILMSIDLASDVWPIVSDRAQIEASITNLAMNARDAMPRGGNLHISTANRWLDGTQAATAKPGEYVMVTVADTGSGMSQEVVSHIFEPFFTTKGREGGTGLGLSMVFGFINQSNGHIAVESQPGAGTCISLFLPRARSGAGAAAAPERDRAASGAPGGQEIVLVVEDNALLRRVVAREVASLGYRTLEAAEAAAALSILETEHADLLFTDIVMPGGMDGFDLAREVKRRWPRMHILLTSGFAGRPTESRLQGLHIASGILRKPYRREELASRIRAALAS